METDLKKDSVNNKMKPIPNQPFNIVRVHTIHLYIHSGGSNDYYVSGLDKSKKMK